MNCFLHPSLYEQPIIRYTPQCAFRPMNAIPIYWKHHVKNRVAALTAKVLIFQVFTQDLTYPGEGLCLSCNLR